MDPELPIPQAVYMFIRLYLAKLSGKFVIFITKFKRDTPNTVVIFT